MGKFSFQLMPLANLRRIIFFDRALFNKEGDFERLKPASLCCIELKGTQSVY